MFDDKDIKNKIVDDLLSLYRKYDKNKDIIAEVSIGIIFADLIDSQITLPAYTDEQVEYRITRWVEDKLNAYRNTLKEVRSKGIESIIKNYEDKHGK